MMNKIKNIAIAAIATVGIFSATLISCNPDNCKNVVCANGGTCNSSDGSCNCASGYEGTLCDSMSKTKFIKSWSATDNDGTNSLVYTCSIGSGTTINAVIISSAFSKNYFVNNVNATISGKTITIPSQQPDADGFAVAGTGTYNSGTITWTYTITKVSTSQTINYTGAWL